MRVQQLSNAAERPREPRGARRAQAAHHAHQLDGQVVANHLEHAHVVHARIARARPAELHHAQDLRAKVDGHGDHGLEGRHILEAQVVPHACIQVVEGPGGRGVGGRAGNEREPAGALLAQHVRGDARAVGNEVGHVEARERAAHPAQLKAAALGEVHGGARRVERLGHAVEHRVEQRGHIAGAHGGHDDRQGARETLVGRLELREQALRLAIVRVLLLKAADGDDVAVAGRIALPALAELDRAHANGDERAIGELEHERVLFAVGGKGHLVSRRALELRAVQQVFDVGSHELGPAGLSQREELAVDVADRAVLVAYGDGIARHLDQAGDVVQFLVVHVLHAPPPPCPNDASAQDDVRIAQSRAIYSKNANPQGARVSIAWCRRRDLNPHDQKAVTSTSS